MRTFSFLFITVLFLIQTNCIAQNPDFGKFTGFTHIGNTAAAGNIKYDSDNQLYELEGSSGNMWADHDDFHFLWMKLKGNFIMQARVAFVGAGAELHRKVGIMIRHSLEPNSPHANVVVHGDGLTSLQYRKQPGGETEETKSSVSAADVIQLERKNNTLIMSVARFGEPFAVTKSSEIILGDEVYVGIFLWSHNETAIEKGVFRNVQLTIPIKEDFTPYRDYIGSKLEVMDVTSGHRKIVYTADATLQCPNWTKDGSALIYDNGGLLYNFNLQSGTTSQIPSGFANKNNNDHALSFDGKTIGISHNNKDDNGNSVVYTLPVSGGTPQRITPLSPSYFHGWSPDGKFLVYTGGRNGDYDIYKIPIKGGNEIQLTNTKGLDDGSEYTPDGKFIYFNSVRSGTMQIWRMKPDGSKPEQVTNDEFNNWFPHISPDGKWIVFLSYMKEVPAGDHPFYKHVYVRLMPISEGPATVIAYVYGGQGTMNVPSWSPDSKRIAFVSNTDMK